MFFLPGTPPRPAPFTEQKLLQSEANPPPSIQVWVSSESPARPGHNPRNRLPRLLRSHGLAIGAPVSARPGQGAGSSSPPWERARFPTFSSRRQPSSGPGRCLAAPQASTLPGLPLGPREPFLTHLPARAARTRRLRGGLGTRLSEPLGPPARKTLREHSRAPRGGDGVGSSRNTLWFGACREGSSLCKRIPKQLFLRTAAATLPLQS